MGYLKLCQIYVSGENNNIPYIEDCEGEVLILQSFTYPGTFFCEVIDWVSEDQYRKRGEVISASTQEVILNEDPGDIRNAIYLELKKVYPDIIK
jgi:hypothetical protein